MTTSIVELKGILLLKPAFLGISATTPAGIWMGLKKGEEGVNRVVEWKAKISGAEEIEDKGKPEGFDITKKEWEGMEAKDWLDMRAGRKQVVYKIAMKSETKSYESKLEDATGVKGMFEVIRGEVKDQKIIGHREKNICMLIVGKEGEEVNMIALKKVGEENKKKMWMGESTASGEESKGEIKQECEGIKEKVIEAKGQKVLIVRRGFVGGIGSFVFPESVFQHFEPSMKAQFDKVYEELKKGNLELMRALGKNFLKIQGQVVWYEYGSVGVIANKDVAREWVVLDVVSWKNEAKKSQKDNRNRASYFDVKEIEIGEKVISTCLEEVVISNEYIGNGSKDILSWGTIDRPSLTRELLK